MTTTDERGATVTNANVYALSEAYTAFKLVQAADTIQSPVPATPPAVATAVGEAFDACRWANGARLHSPSVGVLNDPAEGRVVLLAGLALNEDLVLGLAGRALERSTRVLVGDEDTPGELTGALVALLDDVRRRASRRVFEKLQERLRHEKVPGL